MTMRTFTVLLALLAATPVAAQRLAPSSAAPLTLAAALDSARRNNPDLLIARSILDSARAEGRIARALPNPQLAAIPGTPFQYSATLPLDIGPQRWNRTRVAELGVTASVDDARDAQRQVELAVARSYEDVLLADARRRIVTDRRDVMRQLVAADLARVHAGDLPERALIRSQVELLRADADQSRAGVDAQAARFALQAQMGIAHPDTAVVLADTLAYRDEPLADDVDALRASSAQRPDVAAARTREAQAVAGQRLAASYLVPVPQISYVQQFGTPFQTGRYYAIGLGFELPLINGYRGQRERAAASHAAASLAATRVTASAERDVATATAQFTSARALLRQYEAGVLPRVAENVGATRYAYAKGAASLLEVLDALRAQQDVLIDYATAVHDYRVSVHALRAATAMPIQ